MNSDNRRSGVNRAKDRRFVTLADGKTHLNLDFVMGVIEDGDWVKVFFAEDNTLHGRYKNYPRVLAEPLLEAIGATE